MIPLRLITAVRDARQIYQDFRDEKTEAQAEFEREHEALNNVLGQSEREKNEAETALRTAILAEYQATGNKAPAPGCGVRVVQKVGYDPKVALEWAKDHLMCLKLDTSSFEKLAKATMIVECVTLTEEAQATIATDLDKVLKEA